MAALLTWAFCTPLGLLPPLGPFVSPFEGFWRNMERADPMDIEIDTDALRGPVTVRFDERRVPHIFATNDYDLYFAQGYVIARERMWQVDFQSRAAAGRLSEIFGDRTLQFDRGQRRLGMVYGAGKQTEALLSHPVSEAAIRAYADGYNTWLEQLDPRDYPLEYKLLGMTPEPFSAETTGLWVMGLAQTLTSATRAHAMSNARALLDDDVFRLFYPEITPWVEVMIPGEGQWTFEPLPAPVPVPEFVPRVVRDLPLADQPPGAGSNSWAVDGTRTKSGYPMLASDPHLGVTLPSTWYEMQLHSEGINVYGVTMPTGPGILIGFNEAIAWGITAGHSQSLDVVEITFRDDARQEYLHDGEWKPVTRREEVIHVRGRSKPVLETVLYTHHGPVVQPDDEEMRDARFPSGHAIQWMAHRPGNLPRAAHAFNRASNYEEFDEALRHIGNLNLNFTYADQEGTIAIGHYGDLPVRYIWQGDEIGDGSDPAGDWEQFVPFEHLPRQVQPDSGFVTTANQTPVDAEYPYYLGSMYADFSRPTRINQMLRENVDLTMEDFEKMLMDDLSPLVLKQIPFKLENLDHDGLSVGALRLIELLEDWDARFSPDSPVALFAIRWQLFFNRALFAPWEDEFKGVHLRRPELSVSTALLLEGNFDVFPADVREALNRSFRELYEEFSGSFGEDPEQWRYGRDRGFKMPHLAMLPGFGREGLEPGGSWQTVNACGDYFAPSWRMIVELGPEIRARAHYSGGQSGNPGNPNYDQPVGDWVSGRLSEIRFMRSPDDALDNETATWQFRPRTR